MADTDGTRDLYRRWINELWNGDPDAAVDTAGELVADDFVGHWPDRDITGPRSLGDLVAQTHEGFDQLSFVITVGPLVDGDLVAGRWAGEGENSDGPARFFGNDILRVADGKIAEYWAASAEGSPNDQKEPGLSPEQRGERTRDEDDSDDDADGDAKDDSDQTSDS